MRKTLRIAIYAQSTHSLSAPKIAAEPHVCVCVCIQPTCPPWWWSSPCRCHGSASTDLRTAAPPGSPPWRPVATDRRGREPGRQVSQRNTMSSRPNLLRPSRDSLQSLRGKWGRCWECSSETVELMRLKLYAGNLAQRESKAVLSAVSKSPALCSLERGGRVWLAGSARHWVLGWGQKQNKCCVKPLKCDVENIKMWIGPHNEWRNLMGNVQQMKFPLKCSFRIKFYRLTIQSHSVWADKNVPSILNHIQTYRRAFHLSEPPTPRLRPEWPQPPLFASL